MIADKDIVATLAVKDLAKARSFYEQTLGYALAENRPGALSYKAGKGLLFVYESAFAGTNQATGATIPLDGGIDRLVKDLTAKGVAFERYEMPGTSLEGDVHVNGEMRVAWFKDPDGNIICLVQG